MTRHKMLSVSYNWDNETPKITYHANFENYDYVQQIDGLTDVIYDLKKKMEKIQKIERKRLEEKRIENGKII